MTVGDRSLFNQKQQTINRIDSIYNSHFYLQKLICHYSGYAQLSKNEKQLQVGDSSPRKLFPFFFIYGQDCKHFHS